MFVIITQEISLEDLQDQPELFDPPPGPAPEQLDLFTAHDQLGRQDEMKRRGNEKLYRPETKEWVCLG